MVHQWIDDHVCPGGEKTIDGTGRELTNQGKNKDQAKNKGKGKVPAQADIKKEPKCLFCKKNGHIKKDCAKFQQWLKKKGNPISYESNMDEVSHNTWWIDFGSTIHILNSLQSMTNLRKPVGNEQRIYFENKMCSHVEGVGTCTLVISSGFVLEL